MTLGFTQEMNFPEDFKNIINESSSNRLLNESDSIKKMEVMMLNGDTEEIDNNLNSWKVISASST